MTRRCELSTGAAIYPGRWLARNTSQPYDLGRDMWAQMGMNEIRDAPMHQHNWGACLKSRKLYDWQPARCHLLDFDGTDICKRRLLGSQAVFVGDSTTAQLFTSFVLLLGGRFGRNRVRGATMAMITASACNDTLRLSFVRSDLLIFTPNLKLSGVVAHCDAALHNYRWAYQATRDADVLVLGVGQHVSSMLFGTKVYRLADVYSFFTQSFNRTISGLISIRAGFGHTDPSSILVIGATLPVPTCERVAAPQTLSQAALTEARGASKHGFGPSYWNNHRINQLARWVGEDYGATFVDTATMSFMRADDSLARGRNDRPSTRSGYSKADCMHYCLPGVVDTFSQLLYNALGSHVLPHSYLGAPAKGRFFQTQGWLTERGAARGLEQCDKPCSLAFKDLSKLEETAWWPYHGGYNNCSFFGGGKQFNLYQDPSVSQDGNEALAFYQSRIDGQAEARTGAQAQPPGGGAGAKASHTQSSSRSSSRRWPKKQMPSVVV